ncbi:MAG: Crp/Fnr family transcriptional regulator [Acidobacteria bacterium]|nr:Crp/Fnr family transcriptional regulator [Acidobacteriota bacterium]MBV9625143.1 Crp/Fnr family transcriptional regulator [Acidobacteriota bacterium]
MQPKNLRGEKRIREGQGSEARRDVGGKPLVNEILNSIPDNEYELIRSDLELLQLTHHLILHEAGEKIEFAYFLNQGLASLVVLTSDGRSVEIAIVGREGMVGTPLAVGLHRGPYRSIMQIPGTGVRIRAELLEQRMAEMPELRLVLNRYVLVQGLQIAQIAACNRLHEIEQRLARWLLMCQDRVDSEFLPVTHEFLAQMLGTGRPSVSLAAGMLQRTGIIENLRGAVRILRRRELESAACECYHAIQHFNRTFEVRSAPSQ